MPASPLLSVHNLSAGYGPKHPVLHNASLSLCPGQIILLQGPNGTGKTTLLQCLAGLHSTTSGSILLQDRPLHSYTRRHLARLLAYLPQQTDPSALVGATVRDVVTLGRLSHHSWFSLASHANAPCPAVDDALRALDLSHLANRPATELSGGEARRMYLAACLAQQAPILLLDEPFNQFDAHGRTLVSHALQQHLASGGAILLSSHLEEPLQHLPLTLLPIAPFTAPPPPSRHCHTPFRKYARPLATVLLTLATLAFLTHSLTANLHDLPHTQASHVLLHYRLPRLLTAFFSGALLSVAGLLFQTVFRNPMASPYTLGTASGAAFGATLAIATQLLPLPIAAFAGAILSIGVVRLCAASGGTARLLLSGIACSFLFNAASMLIQYRLSPQQLQLMVHWGFGSISAAPTPALILLGSAFALSLAAALASRPLDALLAGDDAAASFGIPVRHLRFATFLFAALLTSCAVSISGPIAFVGLVIPHIVRFIAPGRHASMLPLNALLGGLFLALCDTLPRTLLHGLTPPVGIVTALLGGPTLLALLARKHNS